ncbi:hypothetical protein [Gloeocapsopsis dulcis]|uniref:hypothetical protein n=1 Tax=Gloeocapsopsis dulcis TaxID=2859516 RepID=UPI001F18B02B|nr:hypothetical protein [Gloeocapsopsis dulcis]WNN89053.1 hypothetical protein P0S91_22835 [Gloeocapsopsis dulcis]
MAAEVELVRETAERIWATIIRARAETELRESEIQRVREQSAREQERQRAETLAELRSRQNSLLQQRQPRISYSVNIIAGSPARCLERSHSSPRPPSTGTTGTGAAKHE